VCDIERAGVPEPRQRDMRGELARIRRQAEALADALDFGLKCIHLGRRCDAGPDRVRLFLPEGADTRKRELEARTVDTVECFDDLVGDVAFDVAEKTQGEVVVFDIDPAGA